MSGPDSQPRPSVSTAPAEGASSGTTSPSTPLRDRRLPEHIGHARLSTVLLAVAFVLIGTLYLFVKPPEPAEAGGATSDPASTSRQTEQTPEAPNSPEPSPTTEVPTSSGSALATTSGTAPTETTAPEETTESPAEPTATTETTAPAEPTPTDAPPEPTSEPAPETAAPSS